MYIYVLLYIYIYIYIYKALISKKFCLKISLFLLPFAVRQHSAEGKYPHQKEKFL